MLGKESPLGIATNAGMLCGTRCCTSWPTRTVECIVSTCECCEQSKSWHAKMMHSRRTGVGHSECDALSSATSKYVICDALAQSLQLTSSLAHWLKGTEASRFRTVVEFKTLRHTGCTLAQSKAAHIRSFSINRCSRVAGCLVLLAMDLMTPTKSSSL
jgi:hypothetical protein